MIGGYIAVAIIVILIVIGCIISKRRCVNQTKGFYWPDSLGYNVPENLDQAISHLDHIAPVSVKLMIRDTPEDVPYYHHHESVGRLLRNEWGLWNKHSRLHKYFKKMGLWHPDDMSSVILGVYRCHLNTAKYDLSRHIKISKKYWKGLGMDHEGNAI